MREYFETSRRTCRKIWLGEEAPDESFFPMFQSLRPVIMTGWEMPLLLRAIVQARPELSLLQSWEAVRDELVKSGKPHGDALVSKLAHTPDEVRRDWIATVKTGSSAMFHTVRSMTYAACWPSPNTPYL
jgi:hypothetical protein